MVLNLLFSRGFILSSLSAIAAMPASAQSSISFTEPGIYRYLVPEDAGTLQIAVKGGAGGAGGWDDAHGGDGAGGTNMTATLAVRGGETVELVVGGGGQGALGVPNFGQPGVGGGVADKLPGAGGSGGKSGPLGSSPGGAGGGGASMFKIGDAVLLAAGGGGGGSNSVVRGPNGTWNFPAKSAVNSMIIGIQYHECTSLVDGGAGISAPADVDGSGGSGGGGGGHELAGRGGTYGIDRTRDRNGEPGESGASCTWDSPDYSFQDVDTTEGRRTLANRTTKGTDEASGESGSIEISTKPAQFVSVSTRVNGSGSISPADSLSVRLGSVASLTVRPEGEHVIDSVTGCGGTLKGDTYTTAAVSANCTVTASFKAPEVTEEEPAERFYTVSTSAGDHGSILPGTPQTVAEGGVLALTITPSAGYQIEQVTGCGGTLEGNTLTTAAVTADCTVTASFREAAAPVKEPARPSTVAPVPTLGEWALMMLSFGVAGFAANRLRRKP